MNLCFVALFTNCSSLVYQTQSPYKRFRATISLRFPLCETTATPPFKESTSEQNKWSTSVVGTRRRIDPRSSPRAETRFKVERATRGFVPSTSALPSNTRYKLPQLPKQRVYPRVVPSSLPATSTISTCGKESYATLIVAAKDPIGR